MSWSHVDSPGSLAIFQSVGSPPAATNLATHVASASVRGNSVSGQVTLTADGVGGSIDVQARFPFKDLVAGGIYSVIVTQDSENPTNTDDQGLVWTGGIFTNSGVASLYIATEVTGLAVSGVAIISYFITRVG